MLNNTTDSCNDFAVMIGGSVSLEYAVFVVDGDGIGDGD
jgi:hypothetical protein